MTEQIKQCPECDGEGYVEVEYFGATNPDSGRTGYSTGYIRCDNCHGEGKIEYEDEDLLEDYE